MTSLYLDFVRVVVEGTSAKWPVASLRARF